MAIAFDSAVSFSEEDSTTPTSVAAWTIASTADRFALSAMVSRDFGGNATHSDMLIGTSGGDSMTQNGTTSTVGAAVFSRWTLYGSSLPASGSSRILYGVMDTQDQVGIIGAVVYNGVNQSTPIGDTDVATGGESGVTSVNPSLTLTTVSGDKVVGVFCSTNTGIYTLSSITGATTRVNESIGLENLAIVEVDATTTSTTINPTFTYSATNDPNWEFRAYVIQASGATGYTVTADSGSYALSGQAANTLYARIMAGEAGTYGLTGVAATLVKSGSYSFVADPGAYTLVGANALIDLAMNAEAGTYALTGQAATVTYAPLANPTLTADAGTYALSGQAANLLRGVILTADRGIYSLTGRQAGLSWSGAPTSTGYAVRRMSLSYIKMGL
jgi:hypothetical protein